VFKDASIPDSAATALPPGHEEPTAGHPPVWTVTLAAFSLLGLRSVLAHQLIGAFVGAGGVALIGLAAREVARGVGPARAPTARADHIGLLAAGIASAYAFLWINDGLLMSETMVVVVVAASTIAAMRFWRAPTSQNAIVFGVLGGLAPLTRAELLPYLPIVAAIALLRAPLSWRARLRRYVTCGIVAVAVMAPWVVRNLLVFDKPVFLSNGFGTVLVQTNCDATYGGQKLGYWELYCGLPQPLGSNGEPLDESARDVVLRNRAFDYIHDHETRLLTVAIPARIGRMFAIYDPVQTIRFDILAEGRAFRISALGLVQYYPLVVFSLVGAWALRRNGRPIAPIVTWIGLVVVTAAISFGNSRYRVSAEPSFVILGSIGLHEAWRRARAQLSAGRVTEPVPPAVVTPP
jgi:hypothetical protein